MPGHFAPEDVDEVVACGPDADRQIGPDQQGFFDFYKREILPQFA